MTFKDFLHLMRRRLVSILICAVVGAVAAVAVLIATPTSYTAQSQAYVRVEPSASKGSTADAGSYYTASQLATEKTKAYVPIFTSQSVAQAVVRQLGLSVTPDELSSEVSVTNKTDTLTIGVTATSDSPEHARGIADAVVTQSANQVKALEGTRSPVSVVLMTPANLSPVTTSPSWLLWILIGVAAGLVVGLILALIRHGLDSRIRTAQVVVSHFEEPLLAVLPHSRAGGGARPDLGEDPASAESMRKLRTNLRFTGLDHQPRVILVTSPSQEEGRSVVAVGLAKVMAAAGESVLLVDADLRHPSVGRTFGLDTEVGLPELLVGFGTLEDAVAPTSVEGLSVLASGSTPPNPSELLSSERLPQLLARLARRHVVIIDSPPVLPFTDSVVLSELAETIIMVARAGRTAEDDLGRAMELVDPSGGAVASIVLNDTPASKLSRIMYGNPEHVEPGTRHGTRESGSTKSGNRLPVNDPVPQNSEDAVSDRPARRPATTGDPGPTPTTL